MVKASRYTTLAVAALLLAVSCTQQEPGSTYRDDPDAVRISAQVGNGEGSPATRSNPVGVLGKEESFKTGDRVCVTADGQPAVVYAYDGSSWTPQEDKFLKWNTPTMNFTAWYPAAEGVNADNFTVPADQSDAAKIASADYMTFQQPVTRVGDDPVSLILERRMARIEVVPSFNNQFNTTDYTVSEVTVCGNTKGYSGGTVASGTVEVAAYRHTDGHFYALLSPTSASSATFIKVKVVKNGGTEEYPLEAKGIIATEAGKSYIVNLTVGKDVASVSGVTVDDWAASGEITGSEADQIPYLTFSSAYEQTFTMDFQPIDHYYPFDPKAFGGYFEYSVGGGKWVPFTSTVSVDFGGGLGNLRLRGMCSRGTAHSNYENPFTRIRVGEHAPVACTGDIRTLVNYKDYANAVTENARFCYLFYDCPQLTSAPDLPATELADYCYDSMFYGCKSLTEAPDLPATTLADNCYASMFEGCWRLTKAPELPATALRSYCYNSMFKGCTSLSKAPELPATELAFDCYAYMFYQCENLTEAPELPATRLWNECYMYMFGKCLLITKAPELPATELAGECYSHMFEDCSSLTEAELPAEQLTGGCYSSMFSNCIMLSKVTMKAANVSSDYLTGWLEFAGGGADSRTLTLANSDVYNYLKERDWLLPSPWMNISEGGAATIILLEGSTLD